LQVETGDKSVAVRVDQPGSRILYLVNPREVKFFPLSLMAAAGVFHAAGESWTISSRFYDVTNYGLFSGDNDAAGELTRRVIEEAQALGVQEIILGECGHGFRAFRWEGPNWMQREYPLPVRSILELLDEYLGTAPGGEDTHHGGRGEHGANVGERGGSAGATNAAGRRGRIRVDPAKNPERVTLHDPCNLVRWGGVSEPQRRVLRRCCADFVEMTPNRENNYCCGGGGGMLSMSEYGDRRIASGAVKAEQIRATGAKIVATPCHNCADQLLEINKHYKLGVEIKAVVELVYDALETTPAQGDQDDHARTPPH
jgi:Fe-S oxidoreductase